MSGLRSVLALVAGAVAACGGSDLTTPPPPVRPAAVAIVAPDTVVVAGAQLQLAAHVRDATGQDILGLTVTWASTDSTIVAIDQDGTAVGHRVGRAVVTARTGALADSVGIEVHAGSPVRLSVTPPSATVMVGATAQLDAAVTDAEGNPVPNPAVSWKSSDSAIAAVSAQGLVTGEAPGSATLRVAAGAATATAAVTVTQIPVAGVDVAPGSATIHVGEVLPLVATPRDAAGNPLSGRAVVWTSSDASIASVAGDGKVTGIATGSATVTATSEGGAGSARVTVALPPAATVGVTPGSDTLLTGHTLQLTATARDAQDKPIPGAPMSWRSSDGSVATVDAQGLVSATRPGIVTITATSGSADGTADLTISFGQGARRNEAACSSNLMDAFIPADSFARPLRTVVYIHGGGWVSGDKNGSPWFAELRDSLLGRGLLVVSVDYRLAPGAPWPAQIQDVKCAVRSLRSHASRYGLDPKRIGAFGESVGGHLAALLDVTDPSAGFDGSGFSGFSSQVLAFVGLAGVYDLTRPGELNFNGPAQTFSQWPDSTSSQLIDASPTHWTTGGDGPALLIHGSQDPKVAPAQAQRFAAALQAAGVAVTLQLVDNADHGLDPVGPGPTNPSRAALTRQVVGFLDQRVR